MCVHFSVFAYVCIVRMEKLNIAVEIFILSSSVHFLHGIFDKRFIFGVSIGISQKRNGND